MLQKCKSLAIYIVQLLYINHSKLYSNIYSNYNVRGRNITNTNHQNDCIWPLSGACRPYGQVGQQTTCKSMLPKK